MRGRGRPGVDQVSKQLSDWVYAHKRPWNRPHCVWTKYLNMLGRKTFRRYSSKSLPMTWVLGIGEEPPEASVVGSWGRVVDGERRNPELSILFLLLEYCPVSWLGPQGLGGGGIVIGGMEGEERGGQINIDMVRSIDGTTTLKHLRHIGVLVNISVITGIDD